MHSKSDKRYKHVPNDTLTQLTELDTFETSDNDEQSNEQKHDAVQHLVVTNNETEAHRNSNASNTRTISDNEIDCQFHPNMIQTTEELPDEYQYCSQNEESADICPTELPVLENNDTVVVKIMEDDISEEEQKDFPILSPMSPISEGIQSPTTFKHNSSAYDAVSPTDQEMDETDELTLPYKNNCVHRTKYNMKSFLIIHPRIYALYLLFVQTWPRILLIFDMYTDVVVAYELYRGEQRIWFMLSSLFLVLPFILVWSASLRFIQLYVQRLFDKLNADSYQSSNNISVQKKASHKKSSLIHTLINIFLMIYMFPLIGSLFMAAAEIFWIISDVLRGIKSFIFGTGLIETENREIKAMKSYRRTVEVFSESVPQSMLQFYIFVRLGILEQTNANASYQGVSANALYLSFGVSMVNLCYNFYKFKKEANLHGMSWSEYSLSVLQLAEIPTIKLVPRTPAIKKGYIKEANFAGFKFDKQSITPLLDAINSSKCKLKTIKMSLASLSKLDAHSCKYLGNLLYNTGIKVLISRCSSLLDLKNLFQSIDSGHKGYITLPEFRTALTTLHCSTQSDPEKIFRKLAVRRLPQRDRIYWYDFFKITASVKKRNAFKVEFDLTEIEHPLYFIFRQIQERIEKGEAESTELIKNFTNLYQFCDGLRKLDTINKIFYAVVDVLALLDATKKRYPNYARFVAQTFVKLLTSNAFDHGFYLQRNDIFSQAEERAKFLKNCDWIQELRKNESGCNIFEYCFLFDQKHRDFQSKVFARLFDVWLGKSDETEIERSVGKNGELYALFVGTNGFDLHNKFNRTPLYYAVKHNLENVLAFYAKYVFNADSNLYVLSTNECEWMNDQQYLHSLLHESLTTGSNLNTFKTLLSSNISLSKTLNEKPLAHHMLKYRSMYPKQKEHILQCFEALEDYKYDYQMTDEEGSNILHYAARFGDVPAVEVIIKLNVSNNLLNHKNKAAMTPLDSALWESDCTEIVKVLVLSQYRNSNDIDYKVFVKKLEQETAANRQKWINCLSEIITATNGSILYKFNDDIKESIFIKIHEIHEKHVPKRKKYSANKPVMKPSDDCMKHMRHIHSELIKYVDISDKTIAKSSELSTPRKKNSHKRNSTLSLILRGRSRSDITDDIQSPESLSYFEAVSDTDNSCFGFKHVSPNRAAYTWLIIDLLFNLVQCFVWSSLVSWSDWKERFELGLFPNRVEDYAYKIVSGFWLLIIVINMLAIFGIYKRIKILILTKLIAFIIATSYTNSAAVVFLIFKQQTRSFMILCISFVVLNMMVTFFGFFDVYKIYKLMKKCKSENGAAEFVIKDLYKIINVKDPYLNGKHCEILMELNAKMYRIKLANDVYSIGPRAVLKSNLQIVGETQNRLIMNKTEANVLQSMEMNNKLDDARDSSAEFNTDKILMGEFVDDMPITFSI